MISILALVFEPIVPIFFKFSCHRWFEKMYFMYICMVLKNHFDYKDLLPKCSHIRKLGAEIIFSISFMEIF